MSFGILTKELLGVDLNHSGTSLSVQWLRLHTCSAGGMGSIPGRGRSCMLCGMTKPKQNKIQHCKSTMCAC